MTKTIARLEAQIAQLQRRADALRAKERVGVIERINVAIKHYNLTPGDLDFGTGARGAKAARRTKLNGRKTIKFRDQHGNEWTGHGRAPRWYKEALAAGRTREDLAVSP